MEILVEICSPFLSGTVVTITFPSHKLGIFDRNRASTTPHSSALLYLTRVFFHSTCQHSWLQLNCHVASAFWVRVTSLISFKSTTRQLIYCFAHPPLSAPVKRPEILSLLFPISVKGCLLFGEEPRRGPSPHRCTTNTHTETKKLKECKIKTLFQTE